MKYLPFLLILIVPPLSAQKSTPDNSFTTKYSKYVQSEMNQSTDSLNPGDEQNRHSLTGANNDTLGGLSKCRVFGTRGKVYYRKNEGQWQDIFEWEEVPEKCDIKLEGEYAYLSVIRESKRQVKIIEFDSVGIYSEGLIAELFDKAVVLPNTGYSLYLDPSLIRATYSHRQDPMKSFVGLYPNIQSDEHNGFPRMGQEDGFYFRWNGKVGHTSTEYPKLEIVTLEEQKVLQRSVHSLNNNRLLSGSQLLTDQAYLVRVLVKVKEQNSKKAISETELIPSFLLRVDEVDEYVVQQRDLMLAGDGLACKVYAILYCLEIDHFMMAQQILDSLPKLYTYYGYKEIYQNLKSYFLLD